MKNWMKICLCAAFVILSVASGTILVRNWPVAGILAAPSKAEPVAANETTEAAEAWIKLPPVLAVGNAKEDVEYLLKSLDGCVAVYQLPDRVTPVQITDIRVQKLRRQDEKKLIEGLTVTGWENMIKLLEDFGS